MEAGEKLSERCRRARFYRRRSLRPDSMPLEYLLGIMRDKGQDARSRLDAAKATRPYCHARLSSTELSGPSGGPASVPTSQKLDISGLNAEELDILEHASEECAPVAQRFIPEARSGFSR